MAALGRGRHCWPGGLHRGVGRRHGGTRWVLPHHRRHQQAGRSGSRHPVADEHRVPCICGGLRARRGRRSQGRSRQRLDRGAGHGPGHCGRGGTSAGPQRHGRCSPRACGRRRLRVVRLRRPCPKVTSRRWKASSRPRRKPRPASPGWPRCRWASRCWPQPRWRQRPSSRRAASCNGSGSRAWMFGW